MKRKLSILFSVVILSMTANSAYGIRRGTYCFFSTNQSYQYVDDDVTVVIYGMQLIVYNKTEHVIYLNKEASFAYVNGTPHCLFSSSSYTKSKTKGKGVSVNMGGIANALGIRGPIGSIIGRVNVGGGISYETSTTYYEQKIVPIAPNSAYVAYSWSNIKFYLPYKWNSDPITNKMIKTSKGTSFHYDEINSPVRLSGIINYYSNQDLDSPVQAMVSNYISDIVIGSYKGIEKSPQCMPYVNQDYQWF